MKILLSYILSFILFAQIILGQSLENYKDETGRNEGSNWMSASNTQPWKDINDTLLVGGSYHTKSNAHEVFIFNQSLSTGLEDLEIDVTPMVEQWIENVYPNYGVGIFLEHILCMVSTSFIFNYTSITKRI